MMNTINNLTFFFLFFVSVWSFKTNLLLLLNKKANTYVYINLILVFFYIIPNIIDFTYNLEFSSVFPEIQESIDNLNISIFYNLYFAFVLLFFSKKAQKQISISSNQMSYIVGVKLISFYKKYRFIIWLLFISPFFLVLLYGDLNYYSYYLLRGLVFNNEVPYSHSIIDKFVTISVLLGVIILTAELLIKKNFKKFIGHKILFINIIIFLLFWIHGKRSIVLVFIVSLFILIVITNAISIRKIKSFIFFSIVFFSCFIIYYGKNITDDYEETYKNFRIDFGRDYGVKFAIHNDLYLNRSILPKPFSSYLFNLTFYVPREYWQDKPQTYAVYFTNSSFGNYGGDKLYGWGLTTSVFAEAISNLGFFGLFFAPFIINLIAKNELKSKNPFLKLFSILVASLLLLLQLIAFMPIFLVYLYLLLNDKIRLNG